MSSRTNLSAGIPSSKVKYSKLSSTDDGYIDLQVKNGKGSCKTTRMDSHSLALHSAAAFHVSLVEQLQLREGQSRVGAKPLVLPLWKAQRAFLGTGLGVRAGSAGSLWAEFLLEGLLQSPAAELLQHFVLCHLCQLWGHICAALGGELCCLQLLNIWVFPSSSRRAHPKSPTRPLHWLWCSS